MYQLLIKNCVLVVILYKRKDNLGLVKDIPYLTIKYGWQVNELKSNMAYTPR